MNTLSSLSSSQSLADLNKSCVSSGPEAASQSCGQKGHRHELRRCADSLGNPAVRASSARSAAGRMLGGFEAPLPEPQQAQQRRGSWRDGDDLELSALSASRKNSIGSVSRAPGPTAPTATVRKVARVSYGRTCSIDGRGDGTIPMYGVRVQQDDEDCMQVTIRERQFPFALLREAAFAVRIESNVNRPMIARIEVDGLLSRGSHRVLPGSACTIRDIRLGPGQPPEPLYYACHENQSPSSVALHSMQDVELFTGLLRIMLFSVCISAKGTWSVQSNEPLDVLLIKCGHRKPLATFFGIDYGQRPASAPSRDRRRSGTPARQSSDSRRSAAPASRSRPATGSTARARERHPIEPTARRSSFSGPHRPLPRALASSGRMPVDHTTLRTEPGSGSRASRPRPSNGSIAAFSARRPPPEPPTETLGRGTRASRPSRPQLHSPVVGGRRGDEASAEAVLSGSSHRNSLRPLSSAVIQVAAAMGGGSGSELGPPTVVSSPLVFGGPHEDSLRFGSGSIHHGHSTRGALSPSHQVQPMAQESPVRSDDRPSRTHPPRPSPRRREWSVYDSGDSEHRGPSQHVDTRESRHSSHGRRPSNPQEDGLVRFIEESVSRSGSRMPSPSVQSLAVEPWHMGLASTAVEGTHHPHGGRVEEHPRAVPSMVQASGGGASGYPSDWNPRRASDSGEQYLPPHGSCTPSQSPPPQPDVLLRASAVVAEMRDAMGASAASRSVSVSESRRAPARFTLCIKCENIFARERRVYGDLIEELRLQLMQARAERDELERRLGALAVGGSSRAADPQRRYGDDGLDSSFPPTPQRAVHESGDSARLIHSTSTRRPHSGRVGIRGSDGSLSTGRDLNDVVAAMDAVAQHEPGGPRSAAPNTSTGRPSSHRSGGSRPPTAAVPPVAGRRSSAADDFPGPQQYDCNLSSTDSLTRIAPHAREHLRDIELSPLGRGIHVSASSGRCGGEQNALSDAERGVVGATEYNEVAHPTRRRSPYRHHARRLEEDRHRAPPIVPHLRLAAPGSQAPVAAKGPSAPTAGCIKSPRSEMEGTFSGTYKPSEGMWRPSRNPESPSSMFNPAGGSGHEPLSIPSTSTDTSPEATGRDLDGQGSWTVGQHDTRSHLRHQDPYDQADPDDTPPRWSAWDRRSPRENPYTRLLGSTEVGAEDPGSPAMVALTGRPSRKSRSRRGTAADDDETAKEPSNRHARDSRSSWIDSSVTNSLGRTPPHTTARGAAGTSRAVGEDSAPRLEQPRPPRTPFTDADEDDELANDSGPSMISGDTRAGFSVGGSGAYVTPRSSDGSNMDALPSSLRDDPCSSGGGGRDVEYSARRQQPYRQAWLNVHEKVRGRYDSSVSSLTTTPNHFVAPATESEGRCSVLDLHALDGDPATANYVHSGCRLTTNPGRSFPIRTTSPLPSAESPTTRKLLVDDDEDDDHDVAQGGHGYDNGQWPQPRAAARHPAPGPSTTISTVSQPQSLSTDQNTSASSPPLLRHATGPRSISQSEEDRAFQYYLATRAAGTASPPPPPPRPLSAASTFAP